MIDKMMLKQTEMLQRQFNPGKMTRANRQGEQAVEMGDADIDYKKALTEKARGETAQLGAKGPTYAGTDDAFRDLGAKRFLEYVTNTAKGRALLQESAYGDYVVQMEARSRKQFRANKGWTDEVAAQQQNKALEDEYIQDEMPRFKQRSLGEFIKGEYGDAAFQAAAAAKEGLMANPDLPIKYDVEVMPSKSDIAEKKKDWNALGVERANDQMRNNPDMTKEKAVDWLMDEWFPAAMGGIDLGTERRIEELDGLTADAEKKAVKPYIEQVRKALEKYAKRFIGTGEATEGLLETQRPPKRRRGRGLHGSGSLGRAGAVFLDKITPDALFPDVGKGIYPEDFRDRHPKPKEE
jgi:hypothetical protein